jgi:hypothetical protein
MFRVWHLVGSEPTPSLFFQFFFYDSFFIFLFIFFFQWVVGVYSLNSYSHWDNYFITKMNTYSSKKLEEELFSKE